MKQMIMWVLAAILICGVTSVKAQGFYDFSAVSSSGDTLYYYLDNGIAVVTCPGDIDEDDYWPEGVTQPQGALVIDGTVNHNDTAYTVARIGAYAFYGCSGITSVNIPGSVSIIKGYAFYDCSNLASVTLSDALTEIPGFTFMGCTALTTITLPAGIHSIGTAAFFNCTAMDSVVVKSTTPPSVGMSAFRNLPDSCLLVVPCGTLSAYTEAWGTYFARITEDCGSGEGVDNLELQQVHVYVTDGCIVIAPEDGSVEISADVYDMSGRLVVSLQTAGKTPALPNGIYVVRIGNQTARKVVVKR